MRKSIFGIGSIFMLHRVAPYESGRMTANENMKLSPEELELIIQELQSSGSIFISLDDLTAMLKEGKSPSKNFFIFTLDDGYKDNLTYAYPIFKKYNIPFCIYVTNGFPNKTTNLWWYALEDLILGNKFLSYSGRQIDNQTATEKDRNFLRVRREVIDVHYRDPLSYLKTLGTLRFDLEKQVKDNCLTWAELRELGKDPLVTIGCHTMNHYPLRQLKAAEIRTEVLDSKEELEMKIGQPIRHFAFPFGTYREAGPSECRLVAELKFDTIATATHGHVYGTRDIHRLNRIFLFPLQNNNKKLYQVMYHNIRSYVAWVRNLLRI